VQGNGFGIRLLWCLGKTTCCQTGKNQKQSQHRGLLYHNLQRKTFSKTVELHEAAILACYDYKISTGPLEGFDNKIKTMKLQAYGFRDMEFFKLKIKALHQTKYALVG